MVRPGSRTAAAVAVATVTGIVAVLSVALVADSVVTLRDKGASQQVASIADRQSVVVNRENKGDVLAAPQAAQPRLLDAVWPLLHSVIGTGASARDARP